MKYSLLHVMMVSEESDLNSICIHCNIKTSLKSSASCSRDLIKVVLEVSSRDYNQHISIMILMSVHCKTRFSELRLSRLACRILILPTIWSL